MSAALDWLCLLGFVVVLLCTPVEHMRAAWWYASQAFGGEA